MKKSTSGRSITLDTDHCCYGHRLRNAVFSADDRLRSPICTWRGSTLHQCFPLSHLKDSAVAQFRQHYSDDSITKEDVFHYIYALLHHPDYRERYAANLKRELPRIPFAPDFAAFATAGKELARLHVEYESLDPWPLEDIENRGRAVLASASTKMKLSADKRSLAGERVAHPGRHPAGDIRHTASARGPRWSG